MKNIQVVTSPEQIETYHPKGKLIVVIDVFRATTTIVTALANGVYKVKPCLEAKDAINQKKAGYLVGGERNGQKLSEMDVDNSPLTFLNNAYKNQKLAISTTNGTKAVEVSLEAEEIILGAFINLSAVVQYIKNSSLDVLLVCAGWKGKMSMEDLLFAGAVLNQYPNLIDNTDSAHMAETYFNSCKTSFHQRLILCEHGQRLQKMNKQADVNFCVQVDTYNIVPKYNSINKCFEVC